MAEKLKFASVGEGLPLVFIHGWGLNSGVWQPCAQQLAQHYQVITLDLPGYGENKDVHLPEYSLENIANRIVESIGKPAVYLGWSLGGLVATEIALKFSEQVKGLITVASTPHFVQQDNWHGIDPDILALFHRQLEQDTKKTINNFLKIQAMGSPHIRDDIKIIRDLVMQLPMAEKPTLEQSLLLLEQVDQRALLSKISLPFLRTYGRLDGLVPKSAIEDINQLAPLSDRHIFEQSSHAPFISELPEFIKQLSLWLNQAVDDDSYDS